MATFELQDELQNILDVESYNFEHERDFTSEDPHDFLEAAVEAVAESSSAIQDSEVFGVYRSFMKHSNQVPPSLMTKLLDSLLSGLSGELDATLRDVETRDQTEYMEHKPTLEIYAFLLHWFVTAAEKVKVCEDDEPPPVAKPKRGRGGKAGGKATTKTAASKKASENWSWEDQMPNTLSTIAKVLAKLQTQRMWTSTERDTFIGSLTKPAHHIMESEQLMKSQTIKAAVVKVLCLAVKQHSQAMALQISIIQFLTFYEHLSEPLAEFLNELRGNYDYPQLGDEVVREIAAKSFSATDSKGPRSYGKFLVRYAELCPRSVLKQLSLLLEQLDSESYPMRQSVIEVVGSLITHLASTEQDSDTAEPKQIQKQIANLFNLLLERVLDNSSYVRSKVFAVLAKLVHIKEYKFPKQRLSITSTAVSALDDKNASVRKASASLLVQLLLTHPYIIHGGELDREVWENEYKTAVAELSQIEGLIGKVVEAEQDQEENGEEETKGKKRSKRSKKVKSEDSMQVDEGEDDGDDDDEDPDAGDTEEDEPANMSVDEDGEEADGTPKKRKAKRNKLQPRKSQLDVNALEQEQAALGQLDEKKVDKLRMQKKFCSDALTFIDEIENAMEPMCKLLGSKNKAEVLEVMEFFKVAHEYSFESAKEGVKRMLHLIWSKDNEASTSTAEDGVQVKGIRQRLLETYRILYFQPIPGPDGLIDKKAEVNRITKNLIERTYGATLAELTSLEEMMRIMMEERQIDDEIITRLWAVYSKERMLPKPQRRGAIMILGMLAVARKSIVTEKVEVLLKMGLGPLGRADPILARYTCIALQRLGGSAKKVKGSLVDKTQRIEINSAIFAKLKRMILHPMRNKEWFGMAEQIIDAVYALAEHPEIFCNEVIKELTVKAFNRPKKSPVPEGQESAEKQPDSENDPDSVESEDQAGDTTINEADVTMMDATQSTQATQDDGQDKDVGDAFELSQLLFVVGHVAIKHIVFLELVEREWKRQKDETQAAEKKAMSNQKSGKDKETDELDQVAGNAEDEIGDRIANVRETELLYGEGSLLALYGPMIVHICGSPHKFKNKTLRAAAILAFSKFLCVSSTFCDEHHRLLFKILETSRDANIRSNVVIALGDVAVSFNTIIDENSNELYKGLSDKDFVVKKNTLMVLTHLILNGMIKVKGQLGEMAKCVEDPEPRIADLAKLFFGELSTKENAIYNNLPDVISHLSTGEHAVDEEKFQSTLKYIFSFIEKEKQAESIVDKLCQRFRLSEDPRQWRDIAYCLSLLPFKSERSVKKLIEGLQFYRDKLHEPVVYDRFAEILQKARANKSKDKPDSELDEFEKILQEHKLQGQEDEALQKRVEGKKAAAKKKAAKRATRSKKATAPAPDDDDMYDD
ncbi:non-SMC mitotic condensation complex subunit 1-domain-containing protein [Crepidotus variabilis]|uniref:Condensin complex subunit 1 n=1 Tax=Crepidotus variabilis TaxID=179855 RepID=A0A9P6EGB5_9AGAR|nr:non-SMC mitotic condensation complex subunit 1-domain-containing protein [Crepidotus variabilis]